MIKKLLFFCNLFLLLSANDLSKPKLNLIGKNIYTGEPYIYPIETLSIINQEKLWSEFFISYNANFPKKYYESHNLLFPEFNKLNGKIIGLPFIAPYLGGRLNYRYRMLLIILKPTMLEAVIPAALKIKLSEQFNGPPNRLFAILKTKKLSFNTIICSDYLDGNRQLPTDHHDNIRYHLWAAQWHERNENILKDFQEQLSIGIFEPIGLMPQFQENNVLFNEFKKQVINYHQAYSPDNVRFYIDPIFAFSSFWAVAISQDKQWIDITYFIICNTPQATNYLAEIFKNAHNMQEIKQYIGHTLAKQSFSNADKITTQNWINAIERAIMSDDISNLQNQLNNLRNQLNLLKNKLNQR